MAHKEAHLRLISGLHMLARIHKHEHKHIPTAGRHDMISFHPLLNTKGNVRNLGLFQGNRRAEKWLILTFSYRPKAALSQLLLQPTYLVLVAFECTTPAQFSLSCL